MNSQFTLSCCSTVDLPYAHLVQRQVPVLFYTYVVDGQEYVDDMGRDPEALPRFYRFLQEGKLPQTSQVNMATYVEFFEQQLQKGDLLHIAFTSGQSGSVNNAYIAAEMLREKALCFLSEEIPHGIAVTIETMKEREGANGPVIDIDAVIYCERKSHKGMIIGKGGQMLKKIASAARMDCEELLGARVNLQCWVKVREDWRDNDRLLDNLGFAKP